MMQQKKKKRNTVNLFVLLNINTLETSTWTTQMITRVHKKMHYYKNIDKKNV